MAALAQVLRDHTQVDDPNLLVGADLFDDAGVYRLDDTTAIVVTVDFFPPLVDDPYQFGRIAAANSLSDIYAMGAKPLVALNIVGFPDTELPIEILGEILRGGAERASAAGALIVGGHSVRDKEVKYGLSVTGLIHPDRILTNAGARAGDVLILTKPIGSGVLTSAAMGGMITQDDLAETIDVMTDLNAGACAAILEIGVEASADDATTTGGVHGVTDITGFGLLGHAHEMASASKVTIEIDSSKVPLLTDALRFANMGIITRTHRTNLDFIGEGFAGTCPDEVLTNVLADAQTSGGLLISVTPDKADALVEALRRHQTRAAVIVGRVLGSSEHTVVLK